ncbi:chemotaxis protein CheW [Granulicella tundricola]|uniref:CheW protein n=1 Tax=Granulicella tundricola (strain ATCC BAA-1859 / DSM 23138 / MP5ACTX9) TaxID=1198114 RepID=E8X303_GRATM|nr:chemotaxis protein CheW [Granulicella tundricola]ADW68137.1 CheW protein [Granulicella tundricola MP5ACTX9]
MSEEEVSLCCVYAGERAFGIDTRQVCEVLGRRPVQRVPLAPKFLGGVVPYRGEVLTTVSLRAVLGLEDAEGDGFVMVIDGGVGAKNEDGRFGLMVDEVGGVAMFRVESEVANPATLDARSRAVFDGAFRVDAGLMVRLDVSRLWPVRLRDSGLIWDEEREAGCGL